MEIANRIAGGQPNVSTPERLQVSWPTPIPAARYCSISIFRIAGSWAYYSARLAPRAKPARRAAHRAV
jgi:hypothetical protein